MTKTIYLEVRIFWMTKTLYRLIFLYLPYWKFDEVSYRELIMNI